MKRFKDVLRIFISFLLDWKSNRAYGSKGTSKELDFNILKSCFFHRLGSQQVKYHELHTRIGAEGGEGPLTFQKFLLPSYIFGEKM